MKLVALDIATQVGWAYFPADGAAPKCGTWKVPGAWAADDYGARFSRFHSWLCDVLTTFEPAALAFESPVLPRGSMNLQTTEHTLRTLIGMAAVAELIATLRGLRCLEVNVSTAKKAFTGNGRAEKADMMAAASRRGFGVQDHHQADACAVGLVAYASIRARAA